MFKHLSWQVNLMLDLSSCKLDTQAKAVQYPKESSKQKQASRHLDAAHC